MDGAEDSADGQRGARSRFRWTRWSSPSGVPMAMTSSPTFASSELANSTNGRSTPSIRRIASPKTRYILRMRSAIA